MLRYFSIIFLVILSINFCQAQLNNKISFDSKSSELKGLFMQKKYSEALKLVNRLIIDNPEEGINYFSRAAINYKKNKPSFEVDTSIKNDCTQALSLNYSNAEVNYLLFLTHLRNIDYFDSDGLSYVRAVKRYEVTYFEMSQTIEQINNAIDKKLWIENEKYLSARMYLLGRIFYPTGYSITNSDLILLKNDCNYLTRYGKTATSRAKAYWLLSQIELYKNKDTVKALETISNAIENTPNDFDLYYHRGRLKSNVGYYAGAIADYSNFINRKKILDNFQDATVFYRRGQCYSELKKFSLAVTDFTKAIEMYNDEKKNLQQKNDLLANSRIDGINISLRFYYFNRGLAYVELKEGNKACNDFNKAVDLGLTDAIDSIKKFCK